MPADTASLQKAALRQTRHSDERSERDCATVIMAAEPADLAAIHRSSVNLALWIRRLPAALADDAGWTAADPFSFKHRIEIGPINMRRRITKFLDAAVSPPRPSRPLLASDMARLVRLFAALSGFSQINLCLELLDHDACRLFHCDRMGLRLLCTYHGPGTEWLPEDAVDRAAVGGGCNRAICRDPKRIQRLATGTVAIFKGEAHPGNAGRGIRAPLAADRPRRAAAARALPRRGGLKVGTPGVTHRSGGLDSDFRSFRISPLALGLGVRLLWASGLAALLWLAVAWALEWLP